MEKKLQQTLAQNGIFNQVQLLLKPCKLAEINSFAISRFQRLLREVGNTDSTICKHLRHLKAALRWAKSMEMLARVPEFHFPKAGRHQSMMKGRPITDDELQLMLKSVAVVVGTHAESSWKHFLEGLWWSGLRLNEALNLTWHVSDKLFIRLDGKFPMLCIRAEGEKGRRDRLLPMAPEFAEFLRKSGIKTSGYVFEPLLASGKSAVDSANFVSKLGSRIGAAAAIIVNEQSQNGQSKKYASLHDLRRSFGVRWSRLVMPQVLMTVMRHESIETTMRFYVGQDAERIAIELWQEREDLGRL